MWTSHIIHLHMLIVTEGERFELEAMPLWSFPSSMIVGTYQQLKDRDDIPLLLEGEKYL